MGGNGHCAARLLAARAALEGMPEPLTLFDIPYPGFEGRPAAGTFDGFLDSLAGYFHALTGEGHLVYGHGIGGLFALCLRARGELLSTPLLLQGPVLWGLERRMMPRLMRLAPLRAQLPLLFQNRAFQDRFVRRYFLRPLSETMHRDFFAGYAQCAALSDFFRWLNPSLLRELEQGFKTHPDRLKNLLVWIGEKDRVVGMNEVLWARAALGAWIPVGAISDWGHYPMLDDPKDWIRTLEKVGTTMVEGSTYENR